ncbi:unnamed protein product [Brassica rapa]|uniref:Uncharacterized protein n=1 Tax=Brassica campestris TaxID=3711 RepID=A0A8D9G7V1_BRACM|nr:unnamed protein product [Brassica rapa]
MLSPRTNVLICVQMESHRRPVHGRPVCADGHTRTSHPWMFCVCWQTPTDLLCVLNRQPTWAKITQTVHGKGQRAESKDQHADMCLMDTHGHPVCAGGHPRTSCVPRGPKSPEQSTGRASMLSSRTSVLICVLMHSLGRPVCADGHTGIHTDSHRRHVCADGQPRTATDIMPKSPEQSTRRVIMPSPRTNVLICVLMDSHGRPL